MTFDRKNQIIPWQGVYFFTNTVTRSGMSNLQDILNESDSNDLFYKTDNSIKEKKTATAMNPQKMPASFLIFLHRRRTRV